MNIFIIELTFEIIFLSKYFYRGSTTTYLSSSGPGGLLRPEVAGFAGVGGFNFYFRDYR